MEFKKECERKAYEKAKAAYDALMKYYPFTTDDLPSEEWKIIDEHYQGSTFGRIKSFWHGKEKILKPNLSRHGYLRICLVIGGKKKFFSVHRIIATLFIANPAGKPEVNHRDGHSLNNYVGNLEWSTSSENQRHAVDTGLQAQGIDTPHSKIKSEEDIVYIRENPDKLNTVELAEKFGVNPTTISDIQRGKKYKNCGGIIRGNYGVPDEEDKEKILAKYRRGVRGCGQEALAKEFGYSPSTIKRIVNGN